MEQVAEHPVIAIEDLRIKNMSALATGTVAAPGKNERQKAGLNRGILDAVWGEFFRQLECFLSRRSELLTLILIRQTGCSCMRFLFEFKLAQLFRNNRPNAHWAY